MARVILDSVGLLAKPSPAEDFQQIAGTHASREVLRIAGEWLQVHISAGNPQSVTVAFVDDAWWLLRACDEAGTDNAGRQLCHLAFARVAVPLAPEDLPLLVHGAYQVDEPGRTTRDGDSVVLPAADEADLEQYLGAAICLLTAAAPLVVVRRAGTASRILQALGADGPVTFVALLPKRLPPRFPAEPGLVISTTPWSPPRAVQRLIARPDARTALAEADLAALAGTRTTAAQRMDLLGFAAGKQLTPAIAALPGALDWLITTRNGRANALAEADASRVSSWLKRGLLTAADLPAVQGRIEAEDGPHLAAVLAGEPRALDRFIDLVGPEAPGADRLLPPAARETWDRLSHGEWTDANGRTFEDEGEDLRCLADAGLLDRIELHALAKLRARARLAWVEPRFERALEDAGLSAPLVATLCRGVPFTAPPLPATPAALPAPEPLWVSGFTAEELLEAGRHLCGQRETRTWWLQALAIHPGIEPRQIPSLDGAWSEIAATWLLAAFADAEVTREQATATFVRWWREAQLAGDPSPDGPALVKLLCAIGMQPGRMVRAVLGIRVMEAQGRNLDASAAQERDLENLRLFVHVGALRATDIYDAVEHGAPCDVLRAIDMPGEAIALLDTGAFPPARPPRDWPAQLTPALARQVEEETFWRRWSGGIRADLVNWLVSELAGQRNAALVDEIGRALASRHRLSLRALRICVHALPGTALCAQAVQWAGTRGAERDEAIEAILGARGLRDSLGRWLRAELTACAPHGPIPPMGADEMLALLPLLDPVRDVLRPILHDPGLHESEADLLDQLVPRLATSTAMAAPPPPTARWCRLRPDWIAAVAELPGWESWKRAGGETETDEQETTPGEDQA